MRTIALEEHFATPAFLDGPGRPLKERAETSGGGLAALVGQLVDIGDGRVAAMDAARIDVQALSPVDTRHVAGIYSEAAQYPRNESDH